MARVMTGVDRVSIGALAVADIGVGLFLVGVGTLPMVNTFHAIVGVIALLLALPAIASALAGRLPSLADEGVLVNIGVLVFMTLQILFLPAELLQRLGLAILLLAATAATTGLYFRTFRAVHTREVTGRHT